MNILFTKEEMENYPNINVSLNRFADDVNVDVSADVEFEADTEKKTAKNAVVAKPVKILLGKSESHLPSDFLEDLRWSEIAKLSDYTLDYIRDHIADDFQKTVWLNDGTEHKVRVIGVRHDDKAGSNKKANLTFEFVDCIASRLMNKSDTNDGGWSDSGLRRWLHEDFFCEIPCSLRMQIVPCVKATTNGCGRSALIETVDRMFLKSEKELYGRPFYSCDGEGYWYEYYAQPDVPYYKMSNGERRWQWLRSPNASNSSSFCLVFASGSANNSDASYPHGVSPAFCI